jgi:hypothetical protein
MTVQTMENCSLLLIAGRSDALSSHAIRSHLRRALREEHVDSALVPIRNTVQNGTVRILSAGL